MCAIMRRIIINIGKKLLEGRYVNFEELEYQIRNLQDNNDMGNAMEYFAFLFSIF